MKKNFQKSKASQYGDKSSKSSSKNVQHRNRNSSARRGGRTSKCNEGVEPSVDTTQHPAWYTRIPGLAEFIGRIPINMISNLPLKLSNATNITLGTTTITSPSDNTMLQPNVVTYYKDLVSPLSWAGTDARSLSMYQFSQEFFTIMRRENMSNMPYDPTAVTLMVLNMAEGYSLVNLAQRTYGMLNYYNSLNRAFPIYLAKAMNLNYEDFRDHMPQFQVRLNMLLHRFDAMRLPRGIDLIEKIATQFSNYYIDTTDTRDTIYIPLPGRFGILHNTATGGLRYHTWNSSATVDATTIDFVPKGMDLAPVDNMQSDNRITVDSLMTYIETFVNNILLSQDFGRIQGDLERAFGSKGFYTLVPMPTDYMVAPTYDEMALMQLHNADLINPYAFISQANNMGRDVYFDLNSSTGKAGGSWCYGIDTSNTSNSNAFKQFNEMNVYSSKDTASGTWPTLSKGIHDRYLCMNPEQITADNVIEFSRNKGPWGADTVSAIAVWLPASDSLKASISSIINVPSTGYDLLCYSCSGSGINTYNIQHFGFAVSIGSTTIQHPINGSGLLRITSTDFERFMCSADYGNSSIPASLHSIIRYMPYQIERAYYSPTAASGTTRTITSVEERVLTFAPVVQPVTSEYLDILGINCWMSLLTM